MPDHASRRPSLRLATYDDAQPGGYFVTSCTHDRVCFFGGVTDGEMHRTSAGQMIHEVWEDRIRAYILANPGAWDRDPDRPGGGHGR